MAPRVEHLPTSRRERGFGLLEAIVALTLLATTGLALFSWINVNLQAAVRLQEMDAMAALKIAAVGLVAKVDPLQQPEGERRLGALEVRWKAVPASEMQMAAGQSAGGNGLFQLQLFDAHVVALDAGNRRTVSFDLRLVGARPVNDPAGTAAPRP